ncbi:MAG: MoaD/ThiS family protein [Candidatus Omnitrophica bacterium]|nr:MoaD/ThiS family protein [Candidatus Omnitrophota bacterium]
MSDSPEKTVHVQYFAVLREERGRGEETVRTRARTARELYGELQRQYQFKLSDDLLRVAINEQFSDWQARLDSGDRVVFLPPVSGG